MLKEKIDDLLFKNTYFDKEHCEWLASEILKLVAESLQEEYGKGDKTLVIVESFEGKVEPLLALDEVIKLLK